MLIVKIKRLVNISFDALKLRSIRPKHDINESLKAMRISIDECKERTARMRASKDAFIKVCSSSTYENQDEDLKFLMCLLLNLYFAILIMMKLNMIFLYLEGVLKIRSI